MTKSPSRRTLVLSIAAAALLSPGASPALGASPAKKVKIEEAIASRDRSSATLKKGFEAVKGSNGEVTVRRLTKGTTESVEGKFQCTCNPTGSCHVTIQQGLVICGGDKCCFLIVTMD